MDEVKEDGEANREENKRRRRKEKDSGYQTVVHDTHRNEQ